MVSKKIHMDGANKEVLKKAMTKDALERLSRLKISSPITATQLEAYIIHVYQTGQVTTKIDDEQLKQVLQVLNPKKDVKIIRKRK
ncbi:MAG: DNA-binding protein [Nanoarchaeota archaeon]|nr:DNA-binding protein [Nanoarchaeota archaeon]